jgi:RND superfamily putative drug exporter
MDARQGGMMIVPVADTGPPLSRPAAHPTTIVSYVFSPPSQPIAARVAAARALGARMTPADHVVGVTGAAPARIEQSNAIDAGLPWITLGTVTLIIMLISIWQRSLLAPLIALSCSGVAYVVAVRAAAWASRQSGLDLPREAEPLILVLLLGIVTDYTVFLLAEGRRLRGEAASPRQAVARGLTSTAPIILTAGLIVTIGTAMLALGRLAFFRALGPTLALTAATGAMAALTLAPAMLALIARWVLPEVASAPVAPQPAASTGRRWARTRLVSIPLAVLCVAGLAYAAIGLSRTRLSLGLTDALASTSEPARAQAAAGAGFAPGITGPSELLLQAPGMGSRRADLARLESGLRRVPGVAAVVGPADAAPYGSPAPVLLSRDGAAARVLVVFGADPTSAGAIDDLHRAQHALPGLLRGAGLEGAQAGFTGPTALASDTVSQSRADAVRLGIATLIVNFVMLAVFLRALITPFILLCVSVLGLCASLGVMVTLSHPLGLGDTAYYVPLAAAVLLVSLGSDYNVFVVGRIWDEARHRDVADAVATATPRAAASITVAGTVLAGSFALLAIVPIDPLRQLAIVLAVGVLIDTFVVRSLLVPALLTTLGSAAGWPGGRLRAARPPARMHEHDSRPAAAGTSGS